MGTRLIFHSIGINTRDSTDEYAFALGLNVITGSYGTGKSSLFELLKYALGARAAIMPTLRANITSLSLDLTIGDERLRLERELGSTRINVSDTDGHVAEWSTTATKRIPRAGQELLRLSGLPQVRLASRSKTKGSEPLSFFDFYRFCYLPQNDINRSVAGHNDRFLDRKRKAVFELAYGLADDTLRALEVGKQQMATQRAELDKKAETVSQFLLQSGAPTRDELEPAAVTLGRELKEAQGALTAARRGRPTPGRLSPIAGQEALLELRRQYAEVSGTQAALRMAVRRGELIRNQLVLDREREARGASARGSLSGLEFVVCPRCLQDLGGREVPLHLCALCTQPQPATGAQLDTGHLARLDGQDAEAEQLLESDRRDLEESDRRVEALREAIETQLASVEVVFEEDDPGLDRVVGEAQEVERLRARLRESERWLDSWSLHDRFLSESEALASAIARNEATQVEVRDRLEGNRERVERLGRTFEDEVRSFGLVRGGGTAGIDPGTYLPIVGGDTFDDLAVGGARKTLANVAFYLANFATVLSDPGILLPSVLVLDSPRTSLGDTPEDRDAGERIYYRLSLLAQAYPQAQVIVADNGVGTTDRAVLGSMRVTVLDYDHPLLRSVPHPGREAVEVIGSETSRQFEM